MFFLKRYKEALRAHQIIKQNSQLQLYRRKPCKAIAECSECFYPSAIIRELAQVDGSFVLQKYRLIHIRIISITLKLIIHVVSFTHNINYVYELFKSILILMNSETVNAIITITFKNISVQQVIGCISQF